MLSTFTIQPFSTRVRWKMQKRSDFPVHTHFLQLSGDHEVFPGHRDIVSPECPKFWGLLSVCACDTSLGSHPGGTDVWATSAAPLNVKKQWALLRRVFSSRATCRSVYIIKGQRSMQPNNQFIAVKMGLNSFLHLYLGFTSFFLYLVVRFWDLNRVELWL